MCRRIACWARLCRTQRLKLPEESYCPSALPRSGASQSKPISRRLTARASYVGAAKGLAEAEHPAGFCLEFGQLRGPGGIEIVALRFEPLRGPVITVPGLRRVAQLVMTHGKKE